MILAKLLVDLVDVGSHELAPRGLAQQGRRFVLRDGFVHALDRTLQSVARRPVHLPASARLLTATDDLSVVAAAEDEVLHLDGPRHLELGGPTLWSKQP